MYHRITRITRIITWITKRITRITRRIARITRRITRITRIDHQHAREVAWLTWVHQQPEQLAGEQFIHCTRWDGIQSAPKSASGNVHDQLNKGAMMGLLDCWTVQTDQLRYQLGLSDPMYMKSGCLMSHRCLHAPSFSLMNSTKWNKWGEKGDSMPCAANADLWPS